ncbi:uncharacterized protein LOC144149617 [Haemaphysalis longicornis]
MEMAVNTYILRDNAVDSDRIQYQPCVSAGATSADIICSKSSGRPKKLKNSVVAGYVWPDTQDHKFVFLAETKATIDEKVIYLRELKLRKRFAWLLYDVHLTDIEGRCREKNHARISHLKSQFG